MNKCAYRPLGTRVIVRILPTKSDSHIVLPDGKQYLMVPQTYEVIAIGGQVNDDKYSLNVGEIVLVSCHESEVYPINKDEKFIMIDRSKIVAAVETSMLN